MLRGLKPFKVPWDGAEWSTTVGEGDLSSLIVPEQGGDTLEGFLEEVAQKLRAEFHARKKHIAVRR